MRVMDTTGLTPAQEALLSALERNGYIAIRFASTQQAYDMGVLVGRGLAKEVAKTGLAAAFEPTNAQPRRAG